MKNINTSVRSDYNVIKPFRPLDVFVYLALLIFIVALFLCLVLFNTQKSLGFTVKLGDNVVLTYKYESSSLVIADDFSDFVSFDEENSLITIYTSMDKKEFNVISFDDDDFSVKVIESNCSNTKECVNSPKILGSGMIFCAPHDLRVIPLSTKPTTPSVGG